MKRTRESVYFDIIAHPEKHRHRNMHELNQCCFVEGAIHIDLVDAHGKYAPQGTNGGVACDVQRGPCSCGASH